MLKLIHITKYYKVLGTVIYISDGVRLLTHQITGLSVTIFLQKRGSLGDRFKKGVMWCEIEHDPGNFNIFFSNFRCDLHFFSKLRGFYWKIEKAKIAGHWVYSCKKRDIWWQTDAEKESIGSRMTGSAPRKANFFSHNITAIHHVDFFLLQPVHFHLLNRWDLIPGFILTNQFHLTPKLCAWHGKLSCDVVGVGICMCVLFVEMCCVSVHRWYCMSTDFVVVSKDYWVLSELPASILSFSFINLKHQIFNSVAYQLQILAVI